MKFTKEDVLKQLKSDLTKGGKTLHLSDRTINEHIDDLLPLLATDETELEDFAKKAFPFVKRADANLEKEKADFIKSYKPKEETKTPPKKEEAPNGGDNELDALKKKLEEIEQRFQQEQRAKTIEGIRQSLKTGLKNKGVKDDEWLDSFIPELNITEDFDVDAKVESYVKIYNKAQAKTPTGLNPKPAGGSSSLDDSKLWDDLKPKSE